MTNVVSFNGGGDDKKEPQLNPETGYISPEYLQEFLTPCQTRVITFRSEKSLRSYRSMVYSINRQGTYRYRTMRDEQSMWGLILYRMK
jgi:hypothetical protein